MIETLVLCTKIKGMNANAIFVRDNLLFMVNLKTHTVFSDLYILLIIMIGETVNFEIVIFQKLSFFKTFD